MPQQGVHHQTHESRTWADKQIGGGVPLFENHGHKASHAGVCKRDNRGRATFHKAWHFCF